MKSVKHTKKSHPHRINQQIKARMVRLISDSGECLGDIPLSEALARAAEANLDLVEICASTKSNDAPICRIMEYGKYLYQESKNKKKKAKQPSIKEFIMALCISEHDTEVKLKHVCKCLEKGDKAKLGIKLRGRQRYSPDSHKRAYQMLEDAHQTLAKMLEGGIQIERPAKMEGSQLTMLISSSSGKKKRS